MRKYAHRDVKDILNCIRDGIFITDGEGNIIMLNKASEELSEYSEADLIDQNVKDLIQKGYFDMNEVVSLKCIETGREESLIQKGKNNEHEIMVTGVPLMRDGKVDGVVVTERDVSTITHLEQELRENRRLIEKYKNELDYYKKRETELTKDIIYCSKEMENTITTAERVAKKDITVLLQGESGTGKEVIANFIHKASHRFEAPFIKVNCGAIPENLLESELFGYEKGAFTGALEKGKLGLFELADGGTLFLDEIGTMAPHLQVKLLRALQDHEILRVGGNAYIPIDVRIIAATNINLKEAVEVGAFRLDLYYRLNVVPITILPLRSRKADIYPLTRHFLQVYNKKYQADKSIDESGWRALYKYHWPGNVRELENMIERLVIMTEGTEISGGQIANQFADFEVEAAVSERTDADLRSRVEEYEKKLIASQMGYYKRSGELAEALGIDKSTLTRKIKKYGIKNIYHD